MSDSNRLVGGDDSRQAHATCNDLYKFLHECVGCGSSFVRGDGDPPWCSVQCKLAVATVALERDGLGRHR
jgi:hypothetical protein